MKEERDVNDVEISVVTLMLMEIMGDKRKNEGELKKWKIYVAKKMKNWKNVKW